MSGPVLRLDGVGVRRSGRWILASIDWAVAPGERWVVVGPNGAGKTTLLAIASTYLWPTAGTVEVLGQRIGRVDARELRRRVGYVSAALGIQIDEDLRVIDVVVSARDAALAPWWGTFGDDDRPSRWPASSGWAAAPSPNGRSAPSRRASASGSRSPGRSMTAPELLLLDEPAAGLDLGAREALVERLAELAGDRHRPRSCW